MVYNLISSVIFIIYINKFSAYNIYSLNNTNIILYLKGIYIISSSQVEYTKQRRLCISVVTRNRPKMLCKLFASLAQITRPSDMNVIFLIVENNSAPSLEPQILSFRQQMVNDQIEYLLEPTLGLSAARNCALNFAIDNHFDYLVYVDDDEIVDRDWLVQLCKERDRLDLDIVGSPVRPTTDVLELSLWQRMILSGIQQAESRSERRNRLKCAQGKSNNIKVATGSWLGRLDFFRSTGLRFDTNFGLTGGEDWQLCAQAKSLGAKTGWACDAIVYETVPLARLKLSYYYRRDRDHNITEFNARYRANPWQSLRQLPLRLIGRLLRLLAAILSISIRGPYGLVATAKAAGGLVGLLQGALGKTSMHYASTTGY